MTSLRVGIVGCGRMGGERASACTALGHTVATVCDSDPRRAAGLAATLPDCRTQSFDRLDWKRLDAVLICTPPSHHIEYARAALRARVPFLLEKPLGISAESCEPLLSELQSCPIVNAVGYMNRCRSSVRQAQSVLASCRTLGIACHWAGRIYRVPWWLDSRESGGPLNEQATHLVDLCRFLVGEIAVVQCMAAPADHSNPPLTFSVAMLFEGGQVGSILYTCEALDKEIGIRILTVEGSIQLSSWEFHLSANTISACTLPPDAVQACTVETEMFLRAVAENKPENVPCDLLEAYRTQLVVDSIRISMDSGQPIDVREMPCLANRGHETARSPRRLKPQMGSRQ